MKKLIILALMLTIVSCGSKDNKNLQALRSNQTAGQDPYSQLIAIKQQYGITSDTDMVSVLDSIKTDLRDSGVYINVEHPPKLRPVAAPGTDWSERKTRRKVKLAYKRKLKNKPEPKGIIWQKTQDRCEDLVVSIDRVDDGSYDASRVAPLIEQYVTLSHAYLLENNLNSVNCEEYKEIDQAQIQMKRVFMGSISSGNNQSVDGSIRNISGLNTSGRGNRQVLPK